MRTPVLLAIALRTSSLRLSGPVLAGRRRLVASMPAAIATVAATAQPAVAGDARTLARQGMTAFEKGDVEESIKLLAAEEADPRYATRLWQRGLSYYYADRFKDARKQFLMDAPRTRTTRRRRSGICWRWRAPRDWARRGRR